MVYFRGGLADFSREGQAVFAERSHRPRASSGSSEWRFKVALGIYDGADFDLAAFPTPEEPIGVWDGDFTLDACVYDYPASGVVGMAWDERLACAFKLLLPPRLQDQFVAIPIRQSQVRDQKVEAPRARRSPSLGSR